MARKFLPYGHQNITDEDIQVVVDILKGEWLTTGPAVESFERTFADCVGVAHAVAFSSGTAALHAAMHVAGVAEGTSVVAPPMTFAATSNSVIYCGGTPIFADISPYTLCLDPQAAEIVCKRATEPVRALVPVSFAGYPVNIGAFREIATKYDAILVEDASHALGAERGSCRVGQEADLTTFSFHPVKHITTTEGGMVTTNSSDYARRMRRFRTHGIVKDPKEFVRPYEGSWDNDMRDLGYNYRLSDAASALGESQLKRLMPSVARRKEIAVLYRKLLSGVEGVTLPPDHPGHSYHLFAIWVNASVRKSVFEYLRDAGIGVQVHYVPVHLHTYYKKRFNHFRGEFPYAEAFSSGEISLPMYPELADGDVEYVVEKLVEALES